MGLSEDEDYRIIICKLGPFTSLEQTGEMGPSFIYFLDSQACALLIIIVRFTAWDNYLEDWFDRRTQDGTQRVRACVLSLCFDRQFQLVAEASEGEQMLLISRSLRHGKYLSLAYGDASFT